MWISVWSARRICSQASVIDSSIKRNKCQRSFHLKCANITRSYFTIYLLKIATWILILILWRNNNFSCCSILFFMAKAFVLNKPTINAWNMAFTLHFFQPILNFVYCLNLRDIYFWNQKSYVRKFAHNFFFTKHLKNFFS